VQNVPAARQNHINLENLSITLKKHVVICKYAIGTVIPVLNDEKK
jgi:hypothetical protein